MNQRRAGRIGSKVLVTGGLGHIGSALIRSSQLRQISHEVSVVDNLSSDRYCSLFGLEPVNPVFFSQVDVRSLSIVDLRDVDVVVHLAAQTDATASLDQRDAVFANNLGATQHVSALAHSTGARLIFASTTSVYGSQEDRVDESCMDLLPQSPYAECKLQEEAVVQELITSGLDAVILRLGTIAGPSPGMRFHTAVNKFCLQASLGQALSVWETAWKQLRPYLDIEDAAGALAWAASAAISSDDPGDRIFNVVTENLSVQQIVESVEAAFGSVEVEFTGSRIMNQLSYEVVSDRIESLGFKTTGSISGAIDRTAKLLEGVCH